MTKLQIIVFDVKIEAEWNFGSDMAQKARHVAASEHQANVLPRKSRPGKIPKRAYLTETEVSFKSCLLIDLVNCTWNKR